MQADTLNAFVDTATVASNQINPVIIHTDGVGYDLSYLNAVVTIFAVAITIIGILLGALQINLGTKIRRVNRRIEQLSKVEDRVNAIADDTARALINANRGMYKSIEITSPYKIIWHVRYLHSLYTNGKERNEDQLLKNFKKDCDLYKSTEIMIQAIKSKLGADLQEEFADNLLELSIVSHKQTAGYFSKLRGSYLSDSDSKHSTPSKS